MFRFQNVQYKVVIYNNIWTLLIYVFFSNFCIGGNYSFFFWGGGGGGGGVITTLFSENSFSKSKISSIRTIETFYGSIATNKWVNFNSG